MLKISRYIVFLGVVSCMIIYVVIVLQPIPHKKIQASVFSPLVTQNTLQKIVFKETSLQWRVQNKHQQASKQLSSLTESMGSGVCTLDINRDGWMDLFFVGGSGHTRYYGKQSWWSKNSGNRLLLNMKGQYFTDISEGAGVLEITQGMGCAVADFNNDGLTDLLITGIGKNQLYANQGNSTFINVTDKSGLSGNHWSMSAALGDFNKDGLLDIYLSNYIDYKKGARTFERTKGFRPTTDIAFDATLYDPQPNKLYLNTGQFRFEDVTNKMEVANDLGRSVGAKWYDINNDSWLDLIVINAQKSANQVFINHKGKQFIRGGGQYAPLEVAWSHDLLINDFNNDQQDEFFISRGLNFPAVFLKNTATNDGNDGNDGKKRYSFKNLSWENGLAQARSLSNMSWASVSADLNNDSYLDIFVAHGLSSPDVDAPFLSQGQKNSIYLNNKENGFSLQPRAFEQHFANSSRGAITADLNNDGAMEIIVSNNNSDLQIFESQSGNTNNWLGIELHLENNSEDVLGASIELKTNNLTLKKNVLPQQSFLSQSDSRVHFGLGKNDVIERLTIFWPDGHRSSFDNIKVNQYISVNKQNSHYEQVIGNDVNDTNAVSDNVTIKIHAKLTPQSLKLLSTILLQYPPDTVIDELLAIWSESSPQVQASILSQLEGRWDKRFLPIVMDALTSEQSRLRLLSVHLLRLSEIESSVNWLIPLLNDSEPAIQCGVAKTFEFYFNEEEAATHRKFLALVPLIKHLDSTDDDVKVCIINALARAERKRAVLPLIKLINANTNPIVQSAAIRALGLIRDKRAIKPLVKIIKNNQLDAQVIASSLIGLSRLDYQLLVPLLSRTVLGQSTATQVAGVVSDKNYQILSYLFNHPDGVVFSHHQLQSLLNQLLHQNQPSPNEKERLSVARLNALAAGKTSQHYLLIKPFLTHPNKRIQRHALKSLSLFGDLNSTKLFEQALLNLPVLDVINVIKELGSVKLTLSGVFIEQLLMRADKQGVPVEHLIDLYHFISKKSATRLFEQMLTAKLNQSELQTLFHRCTSSKIPFSLHQGVDTSTFSSKVLLAYAQCIFSDKSRLFAKKDRQLSLKKNHILHQLLSDESLSEKAKNNVLIDGAISDALIAKATLSKRLLSLPPPAYLDALDVLHRHQLLSSFQELLWQRLTAEQLDTEVRLASAKHLVPFTSSKVLAYIHSNFFTHE
ncbi:FG-GAP-like repeat-containing protein [Psychrobium sp. 1_MG-2023]|uniref:FG-GAP-like repeat-containing protein n=1 Tax=Psychrobium sp. 1_MG-2023 TaxID=3062624 RepID=UPI000C32B273|nr:FG-GAP-like repeat-containing protein [Psychrobium sp. 1_MG-2023]MDP2560631.1 FG-GAP-like repeat-containing protein [Psychrobium sp. 1_MG-2023]PKF57616.1 hypothetical protein CW748_06945 [Alteromonadales bacterium alter-6D02]